jgi:RimJ/RimL family protein N-acetyltransferase
VGDKLRLVRNFNKYISESTIKILVKKPSDCSPEEKETFISLVLSGNQNTPSHVKNSFKHLIWIALLYEGDVIRAVSSLKEGNFEPFEKAGVEDEADNYPYEVGFSFTDPNSRGKGYNKQLKKKLFDKVNNKGIYATIRVTNKESMAVNKKLGFKPLGQPYEGLVTDVQLWVLG